MSVPFQKGVAVEFAEKTTEGKVIASKEDINNKYKFDKVSTNILTSDNDYIEAEKAVVEVMEGYSITLPTLTGYTIENVYSGIVKNGNKLTLVHAFKFTKTDASAEAQPNLVYFNIPSNIGSKLFPTLVGSYEFLDNKVLKCFYSHASYIDAPAWITKYSDTQLRIQLLLSNAVLNTTYYVRYEATFLLSDNLAA